MRKGVKRNGFINGLARSDWAKVVIIHNGCFHVRHANFFTGWVRGREQNLREYLEGLLKKEITLKPSKKSAPHNLMVQYNGLKTPKYYEVNI